MYPYARLAAHALRARRAAPVAPFDPVVTHHRLMPWDIDPWGELNNGRALTLYDIGRIVYFRRSGLSAVSARRRWAPVVAGLSIRYRRRMHVWQRFETRTRLLGWDARFFYIEQGMWRGADCCSHVLIRFALTGDGARVPVAEVVRAAALPADSPALPGWVAAWIDAEGTRPWPPMAPGAAIAERAGAA